MWLLDDSPGGVAHDGTTVWRVELEDGKVVWGEIEFDPDGTPWVGDLYDDDEVEAFQGGSPAGALSGAGVGALIGAVAAGAAGAVAGAVIGGIFFGIGGGRPT